MVCNFPCAICVCALCRFFQTPSCGIEWDQVDSQWDLSFKYCLIFFVPKPTFGCSDYLVPLAAHLVPLLLTWSKLCLLGPTLAHLVPLAAHLIPLGPTSYPLGPTRCPFGPTRESRPLDPTASLRCLEVPHNSRTSF